MATRLLHSALLATIIWAAANAEQKNSQSKPTPAWVRTTAGALAASTAEIGTIPFDFMKVQMMLQRGRSGGPGAIKVMMNTFRQSGLRPFFSGLQPALLRQVSYQSIKMYIYAPLRAFLGARTFGADNVLVLILAGGTAGAIGTVICSPTDLLKVRMQADTARLQYKNVADAISKIYREDGIRGMWRGWSSNTQRSFINNAGELSGYDGTKALLKGKLGMSESTSTHLLSSLGAGLVASLVSNPIDRAKTLLMAQSGKAVQYKNLGECFVKLIRTEGVRGLYKGLPLTYLRSAPWNLLFFVSFEFYCSVLNKLRL